MFKRALIISAWGIAGGAAGLVIPMLFDRDVGGALAASIFAIVGLGGGLGIGAIVSRD